MLIRVIALAAALLSVASVAEAAPLEAYGRLPAIQAAAIAPDGKHFVLVTTEGDERRILIKDVETGQTEVMVAGRTNTPGVTWAGPRYLLVTTSREAEIVGALGSPADYTTISLYDVERRKGLPLIIDATTGLNVTVGEPQVRNVGGEAQIFVKGVRFDIEGKGRLALYRVDPVTRRAALVQAGSEYTEDWLVGMGGEPLAETGYDADKGRWTLKLKAPAGWRDVKSMTTFAQTPALLGVGRDGVSALVSENVDGKQVLRELAPDAAAWPDPFADISDRSVIWDSLGVRMTGVTYLEGDQRRHEFRDLEDQKLWRSVQAAYPGQLVELVSWSDDHQRLIVSVDSPVEGPALAFVDWSKKKADWIGPYYPQLTAADIATVAPVRFKAADGLELSGYLTVPKGRQAKGLPLVVLAHGGPASRDAPGFDWWAQALASRGYAVLQVNFRGSTGYGREFLEAGFGQWGRKMQTDLSDGVRHLAAQGTIDPGRVCVVGASYGGYAALAGATLDRGVYRCAASVSGVSDLRKMLIFARSEGGAAAQRYWIRFMGVEGPNDDKLIRLSPVFNLEGVKTPILLMHGGDDKVVPIEQSYAMARALKEAGNPAELVVLNGEDHWLSRGETRLRMLNAVTMFLEKNNPPS
ncbi:MAG: peptidase S9 [Phenylobacterium sp.]|uniref:alpha/beta hydrolase family protein n=1 Tax=Phenylobacterium sp. TaxID=1871053 RepID=UPI0025CD7C0A|nr:S9 family peptidase [Phenylobacterium sp.]MBA4011165.1 peptidase S9 [Phenylobacterium sp.]